MLNRTSRRRPRRRRESTRPVLMLVGGALTLALLLAVIAMALRAPNGVPGVAYTSLSADLADTGNLGIHNDVRVAGVRVGQVTAIDSNGTRGRVTFKIEPGNGEIPKDSTVAVRGRGLLGARYLEVIPGKSSTGAQAGSRLRPAADSLTYGVPETLDTFDAKTRGGLGDMVGGLGQGLAGRGQDLADAFAVAPEAGQNFQRSIGRILAQGGAAERLVPSLRSGTAALNDSRTQIVGALEPVRDGLEPINARGVELQQTLDEAPAALDRADVGLRSGRQLLTSVRELSTAAKRTLDRAPAGLRAATALLQESPGPLRRTTTLLRTARPAVPDLLRVTDTLDPALPHLNTTADDLRPIAADLDKYACDWRNFTENWRSALGFGPREGSQEPLGPFNNFRVTVGLGTTSLAGISPLRDDLILKQDAYPPACKYAKGTSKYDPFARSGR